MASKYKKGRKFKKVTALIDYMLNGGMVYLRGKVYCPAWLLNWSVMQLKINVRWGAMYEAVLKTKKRRNKK